MGLFSLFTKKPAAAIDVTVTQIKETTMTKTSQFTFTTREEYKVYKEDWKARYAAQILEIRKAKEVFKQANREFSIASKGERVWDCKVQGVRGLYDKMEKARRDFYSAKNEATMLLVERANSKVEAGRQRELRLTMAA